MIRGEIIHRRKQRSQVGIGLFLALIPAVGCGVDAEDGIFDPHIPPTPTCNTDLKATALRVDPTPYTDQIDTGENTGAPENVPPEDLWVEQGQDFKVEWDFAYTDCSSPFAADPDALYPYWTHVEISKSGQVYWEDYVQSDAIQLNSEGWDAVLVPDWLPTGHYQVKVDLDPAGDVPENDGNTFVAENNEKTMFFGIWGPEGPPEEPMVPEWCEDPEHFDHPDCP